MSADLTAAVEAAAAAWWTERAEQNPDGGLPSWDVVPAVNKALVRESLLTAVGAAVAVVREQVAADIEALDGERMLIALVSLNPSAQAVIEWAAVTARGES